MTRVEIIKDTAISTDKYSFYSVYYDGEVVFECMSEAEVNALTISEIKKYAELEI